MGLCGSSPIYHYTDVQLKELQSATPLFTLLGIKWNSKQAQTLHNVFDSCVDNSESEANVNQLCKMLKLPREHFYTNSFCVFGNQSKSVRVVTNKWQMAAKASVERCTMTQYLAGLWNLCTLSLPHGLAIWMYRMHFGNEGAHPANVLELMDRRYGISEDRDYHASIDKRWYGKDYHANNLMRTKHLIKKYTDKKTNRVTPAGWVGLLQKSPGLLQNHISARKALREQVIGERFWLKQDRLKRTQDCLKNIDNLTRTIEQDHPGLLVTSSGREFFNIDHYNFNPPAEVVAAENMNQEPERQANAGDSGIKKDAMVADNVPLPGKPSPVAAATPPRTDVAARALRQERYKQLRGDRDGNMQKNADYKEKMGIK
jgi:hypothetical protein